MSTLAPLNFNMQASPVLGAGDYRKFCDLAYSRCGLNMQEGKEQLVSARLLKVMRAKNIGSFEEYYRFVTEDSTGKALEGLIDALTTNHTSFFRETAHFDFLTAKLLPQLRQRREISIWSAACSTGEEPYTIAITLLESLGDQALSQIRILATDISTKVLARAKRGLFESERVRGLDQAHLRKYFLKGDGEWADWRMVKRPVRERIEFRRFNLVEGFNQTAKFPLIFCRNVMIYFDSKTQERVVNSLSGCLEPGGHLFIGHSESLGSIKHDLQFVAPAIYRKPGTLSGGGA